MKEYLNPMNIVALAGGVGGAKLADGLARILPPEALTVIVNTGDDFEHWGLKVCPDIDTVCYTLAAIANPETGWGRADETWNVFEQVQKLGGADWFRIGDKDLGTHLERTHRTRGGQSLSDVTGEFCQRWGVKVRVLPMSDDTISTIVDTVEMGKLAFQEYFVHQKCTPQVKGFEFRGIETALPAHGVLEAIRKADAIVLCPSNPWVSIDPILSVAGLRDEIDAGGPREAKKTVVAVSPIIGGKTVKGPAAKMFQELGIEPSAEAVAEHYRDILTGFVLDIADAGLETQISAMGLKVLCTDTLMKTPQDRQRVAQVVLNFIEGNA